MTRHPLLLERQSRLALAAALVVALSAGCVGSPAASPTPTITPPATPTATPSATPAASPPATPDPIGWTSLAWSEGVAPVEGQFVLDLVPWSDGYVGVGGVDTGSGLDTAFFTSSDGIQWTLVQQQPSTQSEVVTGVVARDVVRIGNRLLAVGEAFMNAPGQQPDFAAPLWVSDDGTTWTQVQSATWDAATAWPDRLLSGAYGVVAVRGGDEDAIVLHSLDGSTWAQTTLPATERAIAKDAIGFSGGFVIVGRDGQPDVLTEVCDASCPPPGVGRPAAWISADGIHWAEATVEGNEVAGVELSRVVAVRAGFVALGINSTADYYDLKMTSWTSEDGRTWSIVSDPQLPFARTPYPVYAADGDRSIVLGRAPEGSGPAAWMTSDGVVWARLAFANSPAEVECGEDSCLRLQQAWLVPDGVIVMGTPGPITPETFWFAQPMP